MLILASGKYLDRSSADIDDQHPWGRRRIAPRWWVNGPQGDASAIV
jgi:hypothetical protein